MNKFRKFIQGISITVLVLLILFAPLPFGSVQGWSASLVHGLSFFLLFLVLLLPGTQKNSERRGRVYAMLAAFLFFVVVILQIVPLPGYVIHHIAPENLGMWMSGDSLLRSLGYESTGNSYTLSLYPHATWKEAVELLSYFAFGYCASVLFGMRNGARAVIGCIFALTIFQASAGIVQFFGSSDKQFATGTYINRNHFAGMLELTVFVLIGYVLNIYRKKDNTEGLGKGLAIQLTSERFLKQVSLIFILSLAVIALLLSFSRMGMISFLAGFSFMYLHYTKSIVYPGRINLLALFIFIVVVIYALTVGFYPILSRFSEVQGEVAGRFTVWRDSLSIISDFPVFGTGLGTFKHIYPGYKTLEQAVTYNYAHNDYLQLMVETGTAGFLFMMTALVLFFRRALITLRTLSRRGDQFSYFVKLGALSGIVSILVHSLADFNLHIPANALLFALMAGIVASGNKKVHGA